MGLFKQMKDMKDLVHAAPGMIDQSQEMAANAQVMQQQMMAQQQAAIDRSFPVRHERGLSCPSSA